ncbi:MAG: WD40 repeat domain-containing protein [Oscillatoriaceae cyanobacterium Prado104]|jgi:WD40 repeat protein|nr:WD40 repeat domain-containing protein [Oscillatoriaceae cyanobacterium Prado104]
MVDNSNQPREYDAVLGGHSQIPIGAAILGGIAGVKQRFASDSPEARISAVKDAPKYGNAGLELAVQALSDPAEAVRRSAYSILRDRTEIAVREALKNFIPYQLFECLKTVKVGTNVALSPEGDRTASLSGKKIKICDLESGEILFAVDKYPRAQEYYVLGTDSEVFVRKRWDGKRGAIEIWQSGELQHTLLGHQGEVSALAISPDCQFIASGSTDTTIKIWNLETGKLLCTFSAHLTWGAHKGILSSVAFSPSGQILASSSNDGTVKVWNLRSRACDRTLKRYAHSLAFSPDAQTLAAGGWDAKIKLYQLSNPENTVTLEGHVNSINAIAFSPDGRTVASASADGTIKFWNAASGENIHTLSGHQDHVTCLAFSAGGDNLLSGSSDKTVRVWGID